MVLVPSLCTICIVDENLCLLGLLDSQNIYFVDRIYKLGASNNMQVVQLLIWNKIDQTGIFFIE